MNVSIEGNISSGKSTLLRYFQEKTDYLVLDEPVDKWSNVGEVNLLREYYREPWRFAYILQNYIFETQEEQHYLLPRLIGRSIFSTRWCFTELLYNEQLLSELEYNLLNIKFQSAVTRIREPDIVVYLRCDPTEALNRIRERARLGEEEIDLRYLQRLHEEHEKWLIVREYSETRPVLVIECNQYENNIRGIYDQLVPYIEGEKLAIKGETKWL